MVNEEKRFSMEQIISVLSKHGGIPVVGVIQKAGISEQTFFHRQSR